jgi:hypothetical protein
VAMSAYLPARQCPECGTPIDQSESEGRDRIHCSPKCKQAAYRRRKGQCPACEANNAMPQHPYTGQIVRCYKCGSKFKYDYLGDDYKPTRRWIIIETGKKNLVKVKQKK